MFIQEDRTWEREPNTFFLKKKMNYWVQLIKTGGSRKITYHKYSIFYIKNWKKKGYLQMFEELEEQCKDKD